MHPCDAWVDEINERNLAFALQNIGQRHAWRQMQFAFQNSCSLRSDNTITSVSERARYPHVQITISTVGETAIFVTRRPVDKLRRSDTVEDVLMRAVDEPTAMRIAGYTWARNSDHRRDAYIEYETDLFPCNYDLVLTIDDRNKSLHARMRNLVKIRREQNQTPPVLPVRYRIGRDKRVSITLTGEKYHPDSLPCCAPAWLRNTACVVLVDRAEMEHHIPEPSDRLFVFSFVRFFSFCVYVLWCPGSDRFLMRAMSRRTTTFCCTTPRNSVVDAERLMVDAGSTDPA